jgi:excisionase family DNA binding protein
MSDHFLLTVEEAADILRCKRTKVFQLIAEGVLVRGPRFGRKTVVHAEGVYAALEAPSAPEPSPPKKRVRTSRSKHAADIAAVLAELRAS